MGNIKHNDELLRVHDDGFDVVFNCDNKHQNGVSYHAEKNGKKTKIDPEYAMAALVKKISGGGSGGWPEDMPIPSEGGYGYTEQDEQTESEIVHKINEKYLPEDENLEVLENAKETAGIGWTEEIGEATTIIDGTFYYADSSDPVELTDEYSLVEGQSYDVTFNETEYNNLIAFDDSGYISIGAPFGEYDEYPFHIENFEDSSDRSIVFYAEMPGEYSLVVTAANGEVIHKINEKYLPEISPTDEILENAKETGGIGYAEEEVIHKIDEKYLPEPKYGTTITPRFTFSVISESDPTKLCLWDIVSNTPITYERFIEFLDDMFDRPVLPIIPVVSIDGEILYLNLYNNIINYMRADPESNTIITRTYQIVLNEEVPEYVEVIMEEYRATLSFQQN